MKRILLVGAVAAFSLAACVHVTIESTRNRANTETIEPVGIVIFQRNSPQYVSQRLRYYLNSELNRRRLGARVAIVTGVELDEDMIIQRTMAGCRGLILINPNGGTVSENGNVLQALFDVRAFRLSEEAKKTKPSAPVAESSAGGAPPAPADVPAATAPAKKEEPEVKVQSVWRGRVNVQGVEAGGLGFMIAKLMVRLITDGILPGDLRELPPEPLPPSDPS